MLLESVPSIYCCPKKNNKIPNITPATETAIITNFFLRFNISRTPRSPKFFTLILLYTRKNNYYHFQVGVTFIVSHQMSFFILLLIKIIFPALKALILCRPNFSNESSGYHFAYLCGYLCYHANRSCFC